MCLMSSWRRQPLLPTHVDDPTHDVVADTADTADTAETRDTVENRVVALKLNGCGHFECHRR